MTVAFFDLDHTLLDGDSDQLWGSFLRERGTVTDDFQQQKNDFFQAYLNGSLDIHAFAGFMLRTVAGKRLDELHTDLHYFAQQKIRPVLREAGLRCVQDHVHAGHHVAIITATNTVIASAAMQLLPASCDLIATDPVIEHQKIVARIAGTPCFREGKITRAQHYCTAHQEQIDESFFYSDSHNDLPLLGRVRYPHAITPDATLKAIAEQRQWPVLWW